jgi:hypothetical protein
MRRYLVVLALVSAAAGAGVAADRTDRADGATAGPGAPYLRPFAEHSFWNRRIRPTARLDPLSDVYAADVAAQVAATAPWINTTDYSSPIYTVTADQPMVRVHLDAPDPLLQEGFAQVPLPPGAQPAPGTDGHLVVWQPDSDRMWEFWRLESRSDGWHAAWGGAMNDVSRNAGRFSDPDHWGATATSLPLLGGMIRIAELEDGRIPHALALSLPNTLARLHTWPAQRTDGADRRSTAIPQGARLRIDPALDLGTLPLTPVGRMIAEAAQRYGIVVRDTGGAVSFYAEDPAPTGADPYHGADGFFAGAEPMGVLAGFPWDHLQVLATKPRTAK